MPYETQTAMLLLNKISWPGNNNLFVFVGDMNRDSKAIIKMIDEVIANKPTVNLLLPITTNKPIRVGLLHNGTHNRKFTDHCVVSASLKTIGHVSCSSLR